MFPKHPVQSSCWISLATEVEAFCFGFCFVLGGRPLQGGPPSPHPSKWGEMGPLYMAKRVCLVLFHLTYRSYEVMTHPIWAPWSGAHFVVFQSYPAFSIGVFSGLQSTTYSVGHIWFIWSWLTHLTRKKHPNTQKLGRYIFEPPNISWGSGFLRGSKHRSIDPRVREMTGGWRVSMSRVMSFRRHFDSKVANRFPPKIHPETTKSWHALLHGSMEKTLMFNIVCLLRLGKWVVTEGMLR